MALALMPLDKVLSSFEDVKSSARSLFNSKTSELLQYFERTWLSDIELWNLYGFDSCTNNTCEGIKYHYLRNYLSFSNFRVS